MQWEAKNPANIALIKYMGKTDTAHNSPSNPSLSYTLQGLETHVTLTLHDKPYDRWLPLACTKNDATHTTFIFCEQAEKNSQSEEFCLSQAAQQRFLTHLAYIKQRLGYAGHFIVRSANNFPTATGLASSASSFAALTACAVQAITALSQGAPLPAKAIAQLSQHGSGSSCRSFFSPWALWDETGARAIDLPYADLRHAVIILSERHKAVSSSEAHRRVKTSAYFTGRPDRARERLRQLIHALSTKDWTAAFQLVWAEFKDMHRLFETASPPFSYTEKNLLSLLDYLKQSWDNSGDGPLITMDAGPNIHLLFRRDQQLQLKALKKELPTI